VISATRPYVVAHVAVSVNGATTGFTPNVDRFYFLARTWAEDVTLTGADTILAREPELAAAPRPGPAASGPLLAVVDGRRRVRQWAALRECGRWSDVIALRGGPAPAHVEAVPVLEVIAGAAGTATGGGRVDLAAALAVLAELEGARVVRVDSGGSLLGALLARGLIDELSLLVHPCVSAAGGGDHAWHGRAPLPPLPLESLECRRLDDGLVWLRHRVPEPGRS
jgi:2,5-diamino-6-(ribosylamino)-4(3H)-pyrimidinone 5'-phosphate reductase